MPDAQPTLKKPKGEIGVRCVAASCACLGAGKGRAERQSEKMLSSFVVRFFRLPPLPDTAAALRCPATLVPLRSTGASPASVCGSKASRFRGSLLARGFLGRPRDPLSGASYRRIFLSGAAAPLLFCAPAWSPARRFSCRSAKAHRVSRPHRCHLIPQGFRWCLPLRLRRRKGTPAAASD